uniref:Zinc finger CCCH domain-containing protein 10-like protein n=1 Tax=Callorhinchus milii TaxID=7868 RepID=V9LBN7_CALMI
MAETAAATNSGTTTAETTTSTSTSSTTTTTTTTSNSNDDVCRDFLRNVCNRGKRCKFRHPATDELSNQAMNKGEIPICYDYQRGDCMRGASCKFQHVKRDDGYDYDSRGMDRMPHDQLLNPLMGGYDPYQGMYGNARYDDYNPYLKRRRVDDPRCEIYEYDVPPNHPADSRYLEEENLMLRKRIEELKKQLSNLMANNEVLLEENAQLRNQVKVGMMVSTAQAAYTTATAAYPTATAAYAPNDQFSSQ